MAEKLDKPIGLTAKPTRSQEFYDSVKRSSPRNATSG